MIKIKKIIIGIGILILLFVAYVVYPSEEDGIIGNPDFEPVLDITVDQWLKRLDSLNNKNDITIDNDAFTITDNKISYTYSELIKIEADVYSNDQIGDLLIIASDELSEDTLNSQLKPLANFMIQSINNTSKEEAITTLDQMFLKIDEESYAMSKNMNFTYEFYYLKSHGYIFAIRTAAMGH